MFILVDKPAWYTSADIVRKIKKLYPDEKVWHGGTLDPMARGLLIIWVGRKSTKKLSKFQKYPKEYITIIDFSLETDTWDKDYYKFYKKYKVVEKDWKKFLMLDDGRLVVAPSKEEISKILKKIKGEVLLPLPIFSAKKIKGKRLYDIARSWEKVFLEKKMKIYDYKILNYNFPYLTLWLKVWGGTYIRSIWYYLWKKLWLWGALVDLNRIAIWPYKLEKLF